MSARRLLRNMASVTVLRLGIAAFNFALFWLLSHRLGAAELGGFSVLMSAFFLLQTWPLLGVHAHITRGVATQPQNSAVWMKRALVFGTPWAGVLALGLVAYGLTMAPEALRVSYVLLGLAMWPTLGVQAAESALIGAEHVQPIAVVNLGEAAWRVGSAWAVCQWGGGLTGLLLCFLLGRWAVALAYAREPMLRGAPWPSWRGLWDGSNPDLREMLTQAPTYMGLAVLIAVATRIDILLLAKLLGLEQVAVYATAVRLNDAVLMVSTMSLIVVYPVLSRLFLSDQVAFGDVLGRCLRWGLLLGFPLVMVGVAVSPFLVRGLFAPSLYGAAPVLQVLLLSAWWMTLDQLLSTTMLAAKAQKQDLQSMSIGVGVLLAGLLGLSLAFGLMGAAAGVVLAVALRVMWRLRWASRQLSVTGLLPLAVRVWVAAALSFGLFWYVQAGAVSAVTEATALLAAWALYAALVWLLGAWTPAHRQDGQWLRQRWLDKRGAA